MLTLLAAMLLQAAMPGAPPVRTPSPAALALGRRLAAAGGLAAILPLVIDKDIAELADEDKTLTPAERGRLIAIGRSHGAEGGERLIAALGKGYAERLSIADLRRLVAQAEQPATTRLRKAEPAVIMGAMASLGQADLKKETAALFCAETGKLCHHK